MNKTYRIVWNKARCCLMAVAECARSQGGSSSNVVATAVTAAVLALGFGVDASATQLVVDSTNSPYTSTVALDNALVTSLDVQADGSIVVTSGSAVTANGQTSLDAITNSGYIEGISKGIYLHSSTLNSSISNSGTIIGAASAILLDIGSTLNGGIVNTGSIAGGPVGIFLNNSALNNGLVNTGTIVSSGSAIALRSGSVVSGGVANSGSIAGSAVGVYINSTALTGGINNSGTIQGFGTQGRGLDVSNGAYLSGGITNSGLFQGMGVVGLSISNSTVDDGIQNQATGTITGAQIGFSVTASTLTGSIVSAGLVSSDTGGGVHVQNSQLDAGINNSGTIANGRVVASSQAALGIFGSTVSGGVFNSGYIDAAGASAIQVSSSSVDVINNESTGTLVGGVGILISGNARVGSITNSGLIQSAYGAGINISGASIVGPGGINNAGSIAGAYGIELGGAYVSNGIRNSGSIAATAYGIYMAGSSVDGGVVNSGLIQQGGVGIIVSRGSNVAGGITNTGSITSNVGILVGAYPYPNGVAIHTLGIPSLVTGGIVNSGLIQASGSRPVAIFVTASTVFGGIQNLAGGTLSGNQYGVQVYQDRGQFVGTWGTVGSWINGGITNNGSIYGGYAGIGIGGATVNGGIQNLVGGSISGFKGIEILAGYSGVGTAVTGGIRNVGQINATYTGVQVGGALVSGGIQNLVSGTVVGTISGRYAAIDVQNGVLNDGITNAGLLKGVDSGGATQSVAIRVETNALVSGGVQNLATGTIAAGSTGIRLVNNAQITGGITNAGMIQGISHAGVLISAATLVGGLNNSGYISNIQATNGGMIVGINNAGGSIGGIINIGATISSGITNSGTISGYRAISISQGLISGGINNGGRLQGDSAAILVGPQSQLTGGITNSGQVVGHTYHGIAIYGIVTGGIQNSGSIIGTSATGLMLANNATLVGDLNNSGSIRNGSTNFGAVSLSNAQLQGALINAAGGTISSNASAVSLWNTTITGGINNAGLLTATGAGLFDQLTSSLTSFDNTGTVSGGQWGVNLLGTSMTGAFNNSGLIEGTTVGGLNIVAGANLQSGLTNSGSINGPIGINIGINATVNGLVNSGYLSSLNNLGVMTSSGTAMNLNAGGLIAEGLTNSGFIHGQTYGISMINSTLSGGVTNSDHIVGSMGTGMFLDLSALRGGVTNSGTVSGHWNGFVLYAQSSLSGGVVNSGTMSGGNGILLFGSSLSDGVTNSGSIGGLTGIGFALRNVSVLTGGLQNSGTIAGAMAGVSIRSASVLSGGVQNTGRINGGNTAIKLGNSAMLIGGINNVGTISAGQYGVRVASTGQITGGLTNSGRIYGGNTGIAVVTGSSVLGGITNSGYIGGGLGININASSIEGINNSGTIIGTGGTAITVSGSTPLVNVVNSVSGTVIGAINGSASVTNSGLWALQTMSGGVIVDGSHVNTSISGNYIQNAAGSILSIGVNGSSGSGTTSGNYSQLAVGGVASLTAGSINVSMNADNAVAGGGTLAGVVTANSLTATGLTITDNSALVNFVYSTTSGALNLIAVSNRNLCGANITGSQQGPCEIAFDNQTINIAAAGSIGGAATGIKVLSGAITAGSIVNAGTVMGSAYGINVLAGSTFSGGITNSGLIAGGVNAIYVDSTSSVDRIVIAGNNTASFSGAVYAPNTPVTVAGGATYTLNSNFEVSNFANQGTLIAPVASVATPTITGNLTLGNSGTFAPTVGSQTSYSQINVSGNAVLGGTLAVSAGSASGLTRGSVLTGLISANSVTGAFSAITDDSPLYNFLAVNNGHSVGLQVVQVGGNFIAGAAQASGNLAGQGAAQALDTAAMTGAMPTVTNVLGVMPTNTQISNAMSQTLPVMSGATVWNTMSVLTSINRIIEARHLVNKGISSGEDFSGNNALWMKPFGTWTDQGNQNGAYGFKANTGGLMLGGDTTVGADTRLGLAFGWGNSYATSNAGVAPQSQTSNLYQFIGYGSYALSETLEANFQANGGWNSNTSNRQIGFMGTSAQGSYNSAVWHVGAGLSNPYNVTDTTQLIPSARFDYTWIKNQGYSETGASNGLGLNVNSETYQTSILGADLKGIQKLTDHNSVNANIGVGYNFSPTQTWVAASFQGAPGLQFTTNGINPQAVMGRAGVGYTYKVNNGLDLGVRYDIDFQNSYTNQTATAKARWMF